MSLLLSSSQHPSAWSSLQTLSSPLHAIAAKNLGNSLAALVAGFGTAGADTNRIMLCDTCVGTFLLATVDLLCEVVRRVRDGAQSAYASKSDDGELNANSMLRHCMSE